ncbi:type II 3-dehydroquinate dehydratase [Aliifodinibius sp. S!AR15-10]|uniref:type II 3-dehydroquinate dehydratase n=1 Tax=Aliifodinibius sp. S!AR15-10 TaxID=2950437 RepID=UPI002857B935|nr:type II 3-dehydroquinate dehydratase [Aliifodinibius sp. S!AR15-10]MDR8392453.1 type II 3-dehydroquinate dehydratase [Aliifodinibius sp. S!AR15-10]
MKLFLINGPNLNMLGKRDPEQYGTDTLADIQSMLEEQFPDHELTFFQSNGEGAIVSAIHDLVNSEYDGLIANFGAYTHTSVAIRDALEMLAIPTVEVHLSNIHAREEFRHQTLTGAVSNGIIAGFGKESYVLGIRAVEGLIRNA